MISFAVIMCDMGTQCPAKRCLAEKNHAIQAFVFYKRRASGGLAMIVLEQSAQPLTTADRSGVVSILVTLPHGQPCEAVVG